MKRAFIVIGAIVGLMVVWNFVSKKIPSHIEYRGQEIKLSRYYLDYEEYKDDPDNIDPSENVAGSTPGRGCSHREHLRDQEGHV